MPKSDATPEQLEAYWGSVDDIALADTSQAVQGVLANHANITGRCEKTQIVNYSATAQETLITLIEAPTISA